MNNTVVYTAIFGDYDELIEPNFKDLSCDYICFTDQEYIKSDFWQVIYVVREPENPTVSNRYYKMKPHKELSRYQNSMYIDSNVRLLKSPLLLINRYMNEFLVACPEHEHRDCIYDEAEECIKRGKAQRKEVEKQINFYLSQGFPKRYGLREMNVIIRQHNDKKVIDLMEEWWNVFQTYTQRDQLSFFYAVWKNPMAIGKMKETTRNINKYFFLELHKNSTRYMRIKRRIKKLIYMVLK